MQAWKNGRKMEMMMMMMMMTVAQKYLSFTNHSSFPFPFLLPPCGSILTKPQVLARAIEIRGA